MSLASYHCSTPLCEDIILNLAKIANKKAAPKESGAALPLFPCRSLDRDFGAREEVLRLEGIAPKNIFHRGRPAGVGKNSLLHGTTPLLLPVS